MVWETKARRAALSWISLAVVLLLLLVAIPTHGQEETHQPPQVQREAAAGGGDYSMEERQQLLQLERSIATSPDPQATLQQVADANGMTPEQMVNLLQQNRAALQQAGNRQRLSNSWPSTVLKLLGSLGIMVSKWAQLHPKTFACVATTLLALMYVAIVAPRTGLVLSSNASLLSKGPTTVWKPPPTFMRKWLESSRTIRSKPRFSLQDVDFDELNDLEDGQLISPWDQENFAVSWFPKMPRKSPVKQVATARIQIHVLDDFLSDDDDDVVVKETKTEPEKKNKKDNNDKNKKEEDNQIAMEVQRRQAEEDLLMIAWDAAVDIMEQRRFAEFLIESSSPRMHCLVVDSTSVLAMKGVGDWGRFGWITCQLTKQIQKMERDSSQELEWTYSTSRGLAVFDGHLRISIQKQDTNGLVAVKVDWVVPRRGRKVRVATALSWALVEQSNPPFHVVRYLSLRYQNDLLFGLCRLSVNHWQHLSVPKHGNNGYDKDRAIVSRNEPSNVHRKNANSVMTKWWNWKKWPRIVVDDGNDKIPMLDVIVPVDTVKLVPIIAKTDRSRPKNYNRNHTRTHTSKRTSEGNIQSRHACDFSPFLHLQAAMMCVVAFLHQATPLRIPATPLMRRAIQSQDKARP